jgi:cobalt-zinc-cadmium efflux system membrane fusion protein
MKRMRWGVAMAFLLLAPAVVITAGCGKEPGKSRNANAKDRPVAAKSDRSHPGEEHAGSHAGHAHEGWWCDEHGVPEHLCIMCSDTLAAKAKQEGDWCEHDRARSQCFTCSPKQKEYFASMYRAKYGNEPPEISGKQIDGSSEARVIGQ